MKFHIRPTGSVTSGFPTGSLPVALYTRPSKTEATTAGAALLAEVRRCKLDPTVAAWDFLTLALSATVADTATLRSTSPDGWTRQLELDLALAEPDRWRPHLDLLTTALKFLTTDIWAINIGAQASAPFVAPKNPVTPDADCVALLSGGLDSLVGGIDLVNDDSRPYFVSHTVRGDGDKQVNFAARVGPDLPSIRLNHAVSTAGLASADETSQRARSLVFVAYAVLVASTLQPPDGEPVDLYVNENGFIAINPPLTPMRVGSLSTRTAHPRFLTLLQELFDAVGINVQLVDPYRFLTKGQMLVECHDQTLLKELAHQSTSCGRFQRNNYRHCGRCLPCQVRRAAFLAWGQPDATSYVYEDLGRQDEHHAAFDDVRSVALARLAVEEDGLPYWIGTSLAWVRPGEREETMAMLEAGLAELGKLHDHYHVT